jgi:hypothetical protein
MKRITKGAWEQIHQAACDIANAAMMDDDVLLASRHAAMFDKLDTLEQEFGPQAAILATRADYVEDIESKRRLFTEALALARQCGDATEEAEILDSIRSLDS